MERIRVPGAVNRRVEGAGRLLDDDVAECGVDRTGSRLHQRAMRRDGDVEAHDPGGACDAAPGRRPGKGLIGSGQHHLARTVVARHPHPLDVRTDLAVFGVERGRHRNRGRIASAASERRHFLSIRHALVARDDDDLSARKFVLHAEGADLDDARIDVAIVGNDS